MDADTLKLLISSIFSVFSLLVAGFLGLRELLAQNQAHFQTLTTSLDTSIESKWKLNQQVTEATMQQYQTQIQQSSLVQSTLLQRVESVEKTAANWKELADQSIANREKLQKQIDDIQTAREKTALENKQKIVELEHTVSEFNTKLESKQLESDQLQSELTTIRTLYTKLSVEKKDLETVQAAKIESLEKRIVALESKVEQQMSTIKDLEKANGDLSDALKQKQAELDRALHDLKEARVERDNFKALLDSIAQPDSTPSVAPEAKAS